MIMIIAMIYSFFILCDIWSTIENYFQKILSLPPPCRKWGRHCEYLHNFFCPVVRFWCMLLRFSNCYMYISISGSFFAWVSNEITTWRNIRLLRFPLRTKCCNRSWKCTIMTTVSRSKKKYYYFQNLAHSMTLLSSKTPENLRKPEVLWCFQGV